MIATRRLLFIPAIAASMMATACRQSPEPANSAQDSATATASAGIAATLAHGARAWNAGDLDEFLSDYLPDSGTTFVTSRGVLHGTDAIRAVYAARFAPGARRDSLHFEDLEVDVLAPDIANAIAFYVLSRSVGDLDSVAARGPTSLVMRRIDGRWRIVHDHSS